MLESSDIIESVNLTPIFIPLPSPDMILLINLF